MSTKNTAATAGRGFLVITGAKLWFMVGGVLINFGLPYIFGSSIYGEGSDGRALYGQYIDLNNTLSILSMMMITGVMQSVSKFIAERPEKPGGLVRQARKLMLIFGGLVAGAFIYFSPRIAEWRGNPHLEDGYRAAGLILFFYGIYTVYIGTLNGRKQFTRQALYDIGFTTIKTTLVLGLALLGFGVIGAFSGFATAAGIIMALAFWRVGRDLPDGQPASKLIGFASKVMLYTLVFNLIFKLDILLLKPAAQALLGAVPAGELDADGVMGLYGLAVNVSRIPWQATIAITFVVFPLISEATFAEDRDKTRLYIRQTLRYSMLLVGAAAVALAAVPHAIIGLLPAKFAAAAAPLVWLAPAYFFFSLFNVVNTMLMSSGRAGAALLVGGLTVGLAAGLYYTVLPTAGSVDLLMVRAAQCTLVAFSLGLIAGLLVLWRAYGAPLPLGTTLRVMGLGVGLGVVGPYLPAEGRILSLAVAVAVGLTFLIGLVITREFGAEDKARLMRVLGKGK